MKRNPLSIAFGATLKELRTDNSILVSDLAEAIGINDSYYRVLESGATTIHSSKALEIFNGLRSLNIDVDYNGIRDVLLAISYVNNFFKKTEKGYKIDVAYKNSVLESLEIHENKIYVLLNNLNKTKVFKSLELPNNEIVEIFNNTHFLFFLESFITDYENIGENFEDREDSFVRDFFDDVPTYYFEYLNTIKKQLLDMPISINLSEMRKWEERSGTKFKKMGLILKDHNKITSLVNLQVYKYSYLESSHFDEVKFVFLNDSNETAEQVEEIFKNNLFLAINPKTKEEKEKFEHMVNKVRFIKPSEKNIERGLKLLTEEKIDYNVSWVFTLTNSIKVGFIATIIEDNGKMFYSEGLSLKYKHMIKRFNYIESVSENG